MSQSFDNYQAGSCNIGPSEIHRRYQVGIVGGVLYLLLSLLLITNDESSLIRLTAFIPAMVASIGFVQARRKFCLAYGFAGLVNFGRAGDVSKIADPESLAADRAYAIKVLAFALAPALLMTGVVFAF
jgi:hypothetical protein